MWAGIFNVLGRLFYQDLAAIEGKEGASLLAQTVKNLPAMQIPGLWVRKIPWRREWLPTPVFKGNDASWRLRVRNQICWYLHFSKCMAWKCYFSGFLSNTRNAPQDLTDPLSQEVSWQRFACGVKAGGQLASREPAVHLNPDLVDLPSTLCAFSNHTPLCSQPTWCLRVAAPWKIPFCTDPGSGCWGNAMDCLSSMYLTKKHGGSRPWDN